MATFSSPVRRARVGGAFAWEVAKHTTERDRELVWLLYRQKIITTGQARLLFFSSRRRCQDRLLWLYRNRVIDRFYPSRPFTLGKPQAHWLLDEVGACLVAARLGRSRGSLAWDRQQDFHAHALLAHRLECNEFVCAVINATLAGDELWVGAWELGWGAFEAHWRALDCWSYTDCCYVRPDASLELGGTSGQATLIAVEWDRGTEPLATLIEKVERYGKGLEDARAPAVNNVCFIVPDERRAQRLREQAREQAKTFPQARFWVTSASQLERHGPLGDIWRCIDHESQPYSPAEFEVMAGTRCQPREHALGQRWRQPMPERWAALSPLGSPAPRPASEPEEADMLAWEWEQRREREASEAQHDAHTSTRQRADTGGLRSPAGSALLGSPYEQQEPTP